MNLTGHPLVLGRNARSLRKFRSEGRVRVSARYEEIGTVRLGDGVYIPVLELHNGEVYSLPEPQEGVIYVVSGLVAGRIRREDVMGPAKLSRTTDGRVEYARALMRYPEE